MEYYILVDTSGRETGVDVYKTETEARQNMIYRYEVIRSENHREEGDRCELHHDFAWLNDAHGYDFDWSIHMIEVPA